MISFDDYANEIFYMIIPNKLFGSLLEMSPTNQIFFKNI